MNRLNCKEFMDVSEIPVQKRIEMFPEYVKEYGTDWISQRYCIIFRHTTSGATLWDSFSSDTDNRASWRTRLLCYKEVKTNSLCLGEI